MQKTIKKPEKASTTPTTKPDAAKLPPVTAECRRSPPTPDIPKEEQKANPAPIVPEAATEPSAVKPHMSLVEIKALYDQIITKQTEIDDIRAGENVQSAESKVAEHLYKRLEGKVPKDLLENISLEVLDILDDTKENSDLNQMEAELIAMQKNFKDAVQAVGEAVEFTEVSSFDLRRKAKNPRMVYKEGRLKLLRSSKNTRTIDSRRFIEDYPFVAAAIAKIELGKATAAMEDLIKKEIEKGQRSTKSNFKKEAKAVVDSFCSTVTTYSYEFEAPMPMPTSTPTEASS